MSAAADTVDPQSECLRGVHKREGCGCSTCHELLQKLAESDHLTQLLQTEIQSLSATVQDLRRRENCLRHHNTHTEFLLLDSEAENESQCKRNLGEIQILRAHVLALRNQLDAQAGLNGDEVTEKLARMESLMEKKEAQLRKLTKALRDRQEHEEFLSEHNQKVVAELVRLESLREKQNNDNRELKTTVAYCQRQLEKAESLILIREELITKLGTEIAYNRQTIEEYAILTGDLKKSVHKLKAQLERREEEHTLAGIDHLGEKSWNVECRAAGDLPREPPAPQESPAEPEAPAVKPSHCWKWSLRVALCTTGITFFILTPVILASGLSCNCDIAYELAQAFCSFYNT
ncbi:putative restin -like [Scophthalmus maximus]|uniref:Putative restin-like n=1 Tax=Scophthalmus maximus TaxID=52904 RepID=A0A2U9AZA7_SCOMX|nr:putative restin -like [Scophthalmus maximus]